MIDNTNNTGVLQKVGKTLYEFAEYIISPWLNAGNIKPLERRVEFIEQRVQQGIQNKLESQDLVMRDLQWQIDFLQATTNYRLENIINYELRQQVLEVLKEQAYIIQEIIKPAVEDVMSELESKKQRYKASVCSREIQARQDKLRYSLTHIEEITASVFELEVQRTACIEGGQWLLSQRMELAQALANEFFCPQHPHYEEFRQNICRYLKLLGTCMKNEIEPRLLYKKVITHQQPPAETYLRAFQLLKNHIGDWELSSHVSSQAAEELRGYFSYLIDYLLAISL
ncbi:hypothetical protein ACF3DV_26900 [Chlorogloeopsis fritschii PCC 9212]|uniref:Uncharacterized protein n=1 Tax=Chlorogloeopsis fritschii PCC 6912 TaxID=211165 RepID=A0A3S0XM41_CHLFR|nr:hypothetical protein [Chlorogloeopsis fritschii]RUR75899.1 hypothetical protein PCC6912_44710 [Chlorogloeopsis fritschii PCC 6912]